MNGSAAYRQQPDPASAQPEGGSMKRIVYSLLFATLPFGCLLADSPKEKNAKVTLVYQHELPNVPGKSMKGVLVEYGPGGYSPGHTPRGGRGGHERDGTDDPLRELRSSS